MTTFYCFMEIRRVQIEELEKVMEVINDAKAFLKLQSKQWQQGYPNHESMSKDILLHNLFGVYENEELTCVAALIIGIEKTYVNMVEGRWEVETSPLDLVIHRIAISNKYRGKGYAFAMMNFAYKYAKENGCKSIKVDTHRVNSPMKNLLIKCGYKEQGVIDLNHGEEDQLRLAFELVI